MLHLIKYRFISSMRDRTTMFWAMAFPILLGTLFYFTLGSIGTGTLETIQAGVVLEEQANDSFITFLQGIQEADEAIVSYEIMTEDQAVEALTNRAIKGIYYAKEIPTLTVGGSGLEESILQSLLEGYNRNAAIIKNVLENNPQGLPETLESLKDYKNLVTEVAINGKEVNGTLQYFLALIAMSCLYGAFLGLSAAIELKANLSTLALRRGVTSTSRLKIILSDLIVVFTIHFINTLILLAFFIGVLKVDLGEHLLQIILVCLVGCLIGVAMGIFIGSFGRMKEGGKVGLIVLFTMGCSFGAGLMQAEMKNIIEKTCPIINRFNPAALISDALYSISIYENPQRYTRNVVTLAVMAAALILMAFLAVRRERYDSL